MTNIRLDSPNWEALPKMTFSVKGMGFWDRVFLHAGAENRLSTQFQKAVHELNTLRKALEATQPKNIGELQNYNYKMCGLANQNKSLRNLFDSKKEKVLESQNRVVKIVAALFGWLISSICPENKVDNHLEDTFFSARIKLTKGLEVGGFKIDSTEYKVYAYIQKWKLQNDRFVVPMEVSFRVISPGVNESQLANPSTLPGVDVKWEMPVNIDGEEKYSELTSEHVLNNLDLNRESRISFEFVHPKFDNLSKEAWRHFTILDGLGLKELNIRVFQIAYEVFHAQKLGVLSSVIDSSNYQRSYGEAGFPVLSGHGTEQLCMKLPRLSKQQEVIREKGAILNEGIFDNCPIFDTTFDGFILAQQQVE